MVWSNYERLRAVGAFAGGTPAVPANRLKVLPGRSCLPPSSPHAVIFPPMKKFNWQIWAAFVLSLFAFISYFLLFVRFPVTRDFPWANLLLFGAAVVLMFFGL